MLRPDPKAKDKVHLRKSHQHRSDLTGEYAFGDMGQLILLVIKINIIFIRSIE